mmetsp:Transcript_5186/g.6688  ORF Transcript_5186/g.6688 Transcript_5186/m.6688 type:complete len:254 (-) Transcript_5186:3-764(-)
MEMQSHAQNDNNRTTFFEVNVSKDTFKFNAAHFVAYPGFRERLHGHNYRLAVRLLGSRQIGQDGYVIDFGEVKQVTKQICKELNEYFICPMYSPVLKITELQGEGEDDNQESVKLVCEDGATFLFPKSDCAMLPIAHSTAEELAIYCWGKILIELDATYLSKRGIHTMEVTCAEAVGQEAVFRMNIPNSNDKDEILRLCNVRDYISKGEIFPRPCPTEKKSRSGLVKSSNETSLGNNKKSCPHCDAIIRDKLS